MTGASGSGLDLGLGGLLGIRDDVGTDVSSLSLGIPAATSELEFLLGVPVPPLGGGAEFSRDTGRLLGAQLSYGLFDVGLPVAATATRDLGTGGAVDLLGCLPDAIEGPTRDILGSAFDAVVEPTFGRFFGEPTSGAASGGFVLYPSKPNLNSTRAYDK